MRGLATEPLTFLTQLNTLTTSPISGAMALLRCQGGIRMTIRIKTCWIALPIVALAACSEPGDQATEAAPVEAVVADAEESAPAETNFEVCDENGNRYPSEDAAKEAGLEEAQYGATYCQYFE